MVSKVVKLIYKVQAFVPVKVGIEGGLLFGGTSKQPDQVGN